MINVILADDHPVVRNGLADRIDSTMGMRVVAHAGTVEETLQAIKNHPASVVILDLEMPGGGGMKVLNRKANFDSETRIIIFSMYGEAAFGDAARRRGADGYLDKLNHVTHVVEAIKLVASGKQVFPSSSSAGFNSVKPRIAYARNLLNTLSPRELEVYLLLKQGANGVEVGESLEIDVRTASTHKRNIMSKLNISNDKELHDFFHLLDGE